MSDSRTGMHLITYLVNKLFSFVSTMFLFNLICFILLANTVVSDKNTLPVLLIDQDKVLSHIHLNTNPFQKMSTGKFVEIIQETMKHSESIIIFVEETFSVEDLTRKDKHGSPYFFMQQNLKEKNGKYFPDVIEPHSLLTHMFPPQDYNVFYLRSRKKLELIDTFKYIYIYFKDNLNETRIEMLRRHDMIIREVCFAVRQLKPGPVIVFYTGISNPTVIEQLHFIPMTPNPVPKDLGVMIVSSGALFRFTGVYSASPTRRAMFNQLPMISKESWSRRSMSTKMAYTDFELEFNFSFRDYGWTLDDVALLEAGEEVGRTVMRVGAPWNMSYFCAEPLVIVNNRDGSLVTITKYKIQPRFSTFHLGDMTAKRTTEVTTPTTIAYEIEDLQGRELQDEAWTHDESARFGRSTECAKYFSPGIMSGLMVTLVFLLILAYGVVSMMDIHANDRYEDPQSKPLVHPDN